MAALEGDGEADKVRGLKPVAVTVRSGDRSGDLAKDASDQP